MFSHYKSLGASIFVLFLVFASAAEAGEMRSGYAIAHDHSPVYFEVHGTGDRFLMVGPNSLRWRAPEGAAPEVVDIFKTNKQKWIDVLGDDYRLIIMDYPGQEPKPYTMTPWAVVRDFLAIADAAGAEEFAYYGFSWGAVTGLQLALRSDRMQAFIAGGFPMMDGPYAEMLEISTVMNERATTLYGMPVNAPGSARPAVTYYEVLQSFDDRAIQYKLSIPRLNWVGDQDKVTLDGKVVTDLYQTMSDNQTELEEAGWDVQFVRGKSHLDGAAPDVAAPIVRKWLDENWP